MLYLAAAHAQIAPLVTLDEGLRRQEERTRDQQKELIPRNNDLHATSDGAAVPDLPDEHPCFAIDAIELQGPDAQRFRWLSARAQVFTGQCIGTQGVSRIAAYLNAQLINQGYVTSRVSIAAQNLSAGTLALRLHVGRIALVRMVDAQSKVPDTRWGTWTNAFATSAGQRLDARDIEQGVEQMKRLPSQSVATTLTPGTESDTSILTIERQTGDLKERVRGGVTLDNSGSSTLGRVQMSFNFSLDNPLGLNDIASVSANGNVENPSPNHRSQSASASYSIPWGYSTFSATYSHSRFAQNVALTTTQVLSSGDSDTASLKWEHVAWRTASTKSGLYADLSTRSGHSFIEDSELIAQRRRTTALETGLTLKQLFSANASLDLALAYKRGARWIGAQDDLPSEAGVTLRPRIWMLDVNGSLPFKQPAFNGMAERSWKYSASLHGQVTADASTSIDQIGIGTRGTVRGFDGSSVLLAENGWFQRNELSTPLPIPGIDLSLYSGVDLGRVWGPSDINLRGRRLAGAALGVRGKWQAMQFDFALAGPIVKPDGFKTQRLSAYLSATCVF